MKGKNSAWISQLLVFSFSAIIVGTLFKIMHWPGASFLLHLGLYLAAPLYLLRFVTKSEKSWLEIVKLILVLSLIAIMIYSNYYHFDPLVARLKMYLLYGFIIAEGSSYFKSSRNEKQSKNSLILAIGLVLVILGLVFKLNEVPGAILFILIGTVGIGIGYSIKLFLKKSEK